MNHNVTQRIVNKAWGFAHVLRDDSLSYMAYTEQISFLLFPCRGNPALRFKRPEFAELWGPGRWALGPLRPTGWPTNQTDCARVVHA